MKQKVLIYDDESAFIDDCIQKLEEKEVFNNLFEIERLSNDEYEYEINILRNRLIKLRDDKTFTDESSLIDKSSILIIEFDLLESFDPFTTGEDVAYLVRCFSKCDLIIGMNQYYATNGFDSTLRGHPNSYCDLNIGSDHIDNVGLWGGYVDDFRPWVWPVLPKYLESLNIKVKEVSENLTEKICDHLSVSELIKTLPKSIKQFLGNMPEEMAFSDFVFKSGNGLHRKDMVYDKDQIARIATSRISKWFERCILPNQDILIDAPHLVSRFPSLLDCDDHDDIGCWNRTTSFDDFDKIGIKYNDIEDHRYKHEHWVSRPVWYWKKIINDETILEVKTPWERKESDYNFCEDSSKFWPTKECREFIAELESPYKQRYLRYFDIDYQPRFRLFNSVTTSGQ